MSSTPPNNERVVLVTGAGRRVGAGIAEALHAAGCRIAVHYRISGRDAHALCERLNAIRPGSAHAFAANLLESAELAPLVEAVVTHFGRLDGLVNNASSFFPTALGSIDESHWHDLIGSNLKAPLFLCQAAAPHLRAAGGSIVNIIDIHAERPLAGYPLYSTAKAGLAGMTRAMAIELAPQVRVNGVAPGAIMWPEDEQFSAEQRAAIVDHVLLKREGRAEDIAVVVRFLLLEAHYVTGQILAVDGGRSAHL
ncbi:pteridine reductase [Uliginosibacterium sp. H3]|uniref:Pteridine reductase n=1 Tax=Uliginosibacterium silvisoli TaxID=3114758 RepID=A0ABU6JYS4_9RHOO|nr:pteridine reductase [Uliginosibacterium sp. H3]